jgi:nitrogen fixation/metabolism regulation signal transduction histidine kinase
MSVILLFRFIYKTTSIIKDFTYKIKEDDFIFLPDSKNVFGKEFNKLLYYLNNKIKTIKIEKEEQFHLFKTAVNQSGSGIIVFDNEGEIELQNEAFASLFAVNDIKNIVELKPANPELSDKFKNSKEFSFLINIRANNELHKLSVHLNHFVLRGKNLKVASIQNISDDLDREELEAWKKLMHVLIHEIMNSVTPMKTLTYSLYNIYQNNEKPKKLDELNPQDIDDSFQGLKALSKRVQGLMQFVESYRKLYKIPDPVFVNFLFSEVIEELEILFKDEIQRQKIDFKIEGDQNFKLFADKSLITQVIINLLKNAIESFKNKANPKITIRLSENKNKQTISIEDNGKGINSDLLKDIFVPFFTTKKDGTGIGLYYSKLIVLMHKGTLKVSSVPEKGSVFTIQL